MTKNWARHARNWPQPGDIDCDYRTGRQFTGDWIPLPSEEPRDRYNASLPGAPQFCVNQWDKTLKAEKP